MSGDIQFGLKVSYDGKAVTSGVTANTDQVKAFGDTARRAGEQASASLDRTAISAKQTAAALRGVPAQFTDIFTSIAAGQNPMQVMLQQGGQLKDMFGGVGPAARALGGYIAGMVNPFTVAAAAAAALSYAWYKGRSEVEGYTRGLILTGAAAETTAARLAETQRSVARTTGGTQGLVADAMAQAANDARIGSDNMASVAAAAVRMRVVTGRATDETVAEFAKLGGAPVAASLKLNEQYRYLTAATFAQIKALEEQGRTQDAATLAMQTYADAVNQRADDMVKHLTPLENKWRGIQAAVLDALDAMISRSEDPLTAAVDKYTKAQKALADFTKPSMLGKPRDVDPQEKARLEGVVALTRAAMIAVRDKGKADEAAAEAAKKLNDQDQARIKWDAEGKNYLLAREKLVKEEARIRGEGVAAGASADEIKDRVAAIWAPWNKAIADARQGAESSGLKQWHEEYTATVKRSLDESRVDYQGYWALVEAGERHLAEVQLEQAQKRLRGASGRQDEPEAIRLRGEIEALQAKLKTGIAAETERGLAADTAKAEAARNAAKLDGENASLKALEAASAWRRQNLSLIDQELAAAREKAAADLRERKAQLDKNDALKRAPELLAEAKRQAEETSAATLTGIEAEILARQAANAEWTTGAQAAMREYADSAANRAGEVKSAWSSTWKRAENDLANALAGGEIRLKDWVRMALVEFNRIAIVQPMMAKLAGLAGGAFDKWFSSGSSTATVGNNTVGLPAGTYVGNGVTAAAKGHVFQSAGLHQYVNTVVDRPTQFRFAKGAAIGEMGEAGPEGIMPLKRDKQGRLGVIAEGGGGGVSLTYAPVFEIDARGAAVGVGPMLQGVVEVAVQRSRAELLAELDAGGQLAYATGRRRG